MATYHLPSGKTPNKVGLQPDIKVALSDEQAYRLAAATNYQWDAASVKKDPQLQKAIEVLEKKLAPTMVPSIPSSGTTSGD